MTEKLTIIKDLAKLIEKIIVKESRKKENVRSWGKAIE